MLFRQILDPGKGCASYLIGCGRAREAVVVDALASLGVEGSPSPGSSIPTFMPIMLR